MEDHDLLALEASVLFVMSDSGRVVCENSSDRSAAPRLSLAGCASLNIVRVRDDVDEKTSQAIESLAATEPALREPESTPVHIDEYVELLAAEAPVEDFGSGLIWTFPERLAYEHSATLVASDTAEGYRLLARLAEEGMPAALVAAGFVDIGEFWAPWCVALDGDEIASIAFAARLEPAAAETGVFTVPAYRGRGFAAAATAGWARLPALRERTLFYSTSRANLSSQRVTQRLGLRFMGASFQIT